MLSYQEALSLIAREAKLQSTHTIDFRQSCGYIAAQDIDSPICIPPFDNSAMDGFALSSAWTHCATPEHPLTFQVGNCLAAGDVTSDYADDMATEIMTGAKMPFHCDAVVPIEQVECITGPNDKTIAIRLKRTLAPNENVRLRGEDFTVGQSIIQKGTRLHAGHLAAMAATGVHQISVHHMPRVDVITTGKELSDKYHAPLADGEIYDSNTPYLLSHLQSAGIEVVHVNNIGDSPGLFVETLNGLTRASIVISSGAVSKGRWDFIPEILKKQGARIIFHGVAIKPGKPILFAVLPDGRYYFGLPGNPVAVAVGLRFFVQPLIRHLLGMPEEKRHCHKLAKSFEKKGVLRHFLKAHLQSDDQGLTRVRILHGQESFKISPLLEMNCWAIVGEETNTLLANDSVHTASLELFSAF